MKTLIVCDVQPDVVQKLTQPRQFIDLVHTAIAAARQSQCSVRIVHTMLHVSSLNDIPMSHPRLGILRKLHNPKWFRSPDLCVKNLPDQEPKLSRSTLLPHANDASLLETLQAEEDQEVTLIGYGPTVHAICSILGDVLAIPKVRLLKECVRDENEDRCKAFLKHGLLFSEEVVSLVDFLESLDMLHVRIETHEEQLSESVPPANKYVTDCGRGGHLSLFMPYILQDGYCEWPTQPWYKELGLTGNGNKQYHCPMGRRMIELCDEPQFCLGTKFFLAGRQYLDEKNLLYDLVPELLPPTFASIEEAEKYAQRQQHTSNPVWFLKKVNQNGGRAITILDKLPNGPLEKDDQLQLHIPRPLLYHENHERQGQFKCHIKTYQYLACSLSNDGTEAVEWQLYMHDCFYLATANAPWSIKDLSDDAQITTMRTHRLYRDNPWRIKWNLTELIRSNMKTVIKRAVEQGKLKARHSTVRDLEFQPQATKTLQFEVNSADWMLDEYGNIYLIEINGIPVLYDAGMSQELCTRGLRLYDRLYKENPEEAVVNDHDLLKEAIGLALRGDLPETTLWTHVATFAGCLT